VACSVLDAHHSSAHQFGFQSFQSKAVSDHGVDPCTIELVDHLYVGRIELGFKKPSSIFTLWLTEADELILQMSSHSCGAVGLMNNRFSLSKHRPRAGRGDPWRNDGAA
jgi:hypothetical protein